MPRITTPIEDLLLLIGEAIQDDCECWEVDGETLTVTYKGQTFALRCDVVDEEE